MFDLMINLIIKYLAVIVYDLQLFDFDLYYSTKHKNSGYCSIFMRSVFYLFKTYYWMQMIDYSKKSY